MLSAVVEIGDEAENASASAEESNRLRRCRCIDGVVEESERSADEMTPLFLLLIGVLIFIIADNLFFPERHNTNISSP